VGVPRAHHLRGRDPRPAGEGFLLSGGYDVYRAERRDGGRTAGGRDDAGVRPAGRGSGRTKEGRMMIARSEPPRWDGNMNNERHFRTSRPNGVVCRRREGVLYRDAAESALPSRFEIL
jgi:hypothetical protein